MKVNPAGIVVAVMAIFVGLVMASYVWALYHTWIIIFSVVAFVCWVAIRAQKSRKKREEEDGNGGGQGGVHVHFH